MIILVPLILSAAFFLVGLYIRVAWKFITSPDLLGVFAVCGYVGKGIAADYGASENGALVWVFVTGFVGCLVYFALLVVIHRVVPFLSYLLNFAAITGLGTYGGWLLSGEGKWFNENLPQLAAAPSVNTIIYGALLFAFYLLSYWLRMSGLAQLAPSRNR